MFLVPINAMMMMVIIIEPLYICSMIGLHIIIRIYSLSSLLTFLIALDLCSLRESIRAAQVRSQTNNLSVGPFAPQSLASVVNTCSACAQLRLQRRVDEAPHHMIWLSIKAWARTRGLAVVVVWVASAVWWWEQQEGNHLNRVLVDIVMVVECGAEKHTPCSEQASGETGARASQCIEREREREPERTEHFWWKR